MLVQKRFRLILLCCFLGVIGIGCDAFTSIKETIAGKSKAPIEAPAGQGASALAEETNAPMPADALARIGSWVLSTQEFNQRLTALKDIVPEYDTNDPEARELVLEELIRQELLVQEAERTGLTKEKDIVDAVEEFRRTLLVREIARKLTEDIKVTDKEAQDFYDQRKDILIEPGQWHVRSLVVDSKLKANEALIEILKGADFAQMVRTHSIAENAATGGDLGFITEVPFPEMASALLSLSEGDVSSVFKGPEGYYIIKLEEKRGGEQIPFNDIKEDIVNNQVLLKQQQAILDYIDRLKSKTKVEINKDLLNKK